MAVSKEITEAPCLIFSGAGASKIANLMLMKEFVESLRSSSPPEPELFEAICKKEADLEYLFEELSELETKDYLKFEPPPPPTPGFGGVHRLPDITARGIRNRSLSLSSWLREKVFVHYRQINEDNKKLTLLANILKPFLEKSSPLVVFTTNYDPVVEVLCRKHLNCALVDGFRHDTSRQEYCWDRDVFDKATFTSGGSVVLFKLHGSTSWVQTGTRIVKSAPVFGGEDPLHQNALIFPAMRKVAIADPYFTCYDYLGKCLAKAKLCLVIGYSFRDYDALTRFKAANIQNPDLKTFVLDPAANEIVRSLANSGIKATAVPYAVGIQDAEYVAVLSAERERLFGSVAAS